MIQYEEMAENISKLVDWIVQLEYIEERLETTRNLHPVIFDDYIGDSALRELYQLRDFAEKVKEKHDLPVY